MADQNKLDAPKQPAMNPIHYKVNVRFEIPIQTQLQGEPSRDLEFHLEALNHFGAVHRAMAALVDIPVRINKLIIEEQSGRIIVPFPTRNSSPTN